MSGAAPPIAATRGLNRRSMLGAAGLAAGGVAAGGLAQGTAAFGSHLGSPHTATDWHNVKAFGAKGDGIADDWQAIKDAIQALPPSGGVAYLPPGTYRVSDVVLVPSDVVLLGAGPAATVLTKTTAGAAAGSPPYSLILMRGARGDDPVERASVAMMKLDGGWTDPASAARGDGISAAHQVIDCHFSNLWITNVGSYGIGLGSHGAVRCSCHRLLMTDLGNEGLDFKNEGDENFGNVLDTIWIERFGKSEVELGGGTPSEAGIDVRGPAILSNIVVREFGDTAGTAGIRFRFGALGSANGLGGVKSVLSNFFIDGADQQAPHTTGVDVFSDRAVAVSSGTVQNVGVGVEVQGGGDNPVSKFHVLRNVHARDCLSHGFRVKSNASEATLAHCSTDECATGFRIEGDRTTLVAPRCRHTPAVPAHFGVHVVDGAEATEVLRPRHINTQLRNAAGAETTVT